MVNFNKNLNALNIGSFFFTLFVLFIGAAFGGFFFTSICDSAANSIDCTTNIMLVVFIAPIVVNIVLYAIIQSQRYRNFQQGKVINKITGYLEVVAAPVFAGFHFFVYYVIYGFQHPEASLTEAVFPYFSIAIFLGLLIDGIRRIKISKKELSL